jgi:hypothetical protein
MKKDPTFQVDDLVEWSYDNRATPECWAYRRKKYGNGPFRIQSTIKSPEAHKRPDKQLVVIEKNGQTICYEDGTTVTWSCAWFRKVQ